MCSLKGLCTVQTAVQGYIESAEQSRTAKLTVKLNELQIISTEHDCRM